jgi:group I intron endonuclease
MCAADKTYYTGSTNNIRKRMNEHIIDLKRNSHHNIRLQRVFNKYGANSIDVIIYGCKASERLMLEQTLLNNRICGCVNASKIAAYPKTRHTKATRKKISRALKGWPRSPEQRDGTSKAMRGVKHSLGRRLAQSARMRGVIPAGFKKTAGCRAKPVISKDTGVVCQSAAYAAKAHGIASNGVIKAARNGTRSAGQFWEHLKLFGYLHSKNLFGDDEPLVKFPKHGFMTRGKVYKAPEYGAFGIEKGCGLWSTPSAADAVGSQGGGQGRSLRTDIYNWKHGPWPTPDTRGFTNDGSLKMLAKTADTPEEFSGMAYRAGKQKMNFLPTPLASDGEKGNPNRDKHLGTDKRRPEYGKAWPTPTSRDYKDGSADSCKNVPVNGFLGRVIHTGSGARGQLSADWVEALMGYPRRWTDIDKEAGYENDYPEKWLDGTWEDGIPRVAVKQAHRVQRLKCLGNAIVPQCAEVIFRLPAFDRWRCEEGGLICGK